MRYALSAHGTRTRIVGAIAAIVVLCFAMTRPADIAQGRVDPTTQDQGQAALSGDTVGVATGGGTVTVTVPISLVASFGINGKRPVGFTGGGAAAGRINYDRHANITTGRHVNVPVLFMTLELSATPSPNGTGGQGQLIGDCTAPASECPSNTPAFQSVLVYVQDNSDTGANDVFQISFCTGPAVVSPLGCGVAEGGALRTGQIQIRASVPGSGGMSVPTAARAPLRLP